MATGSGAGRLHKAQMQEKDSPEVAATPDGTPVYTGQVEMGGRVYDSRRDLRTDRKTGRKTIDGPEWLYLQGTQPKAKKRT